MHALLIIAALCIVPALKEPLEDRCDSIIRESFYDGDGKIVFVQDIFTDDVVWPSGHMTTEIVAWRLVRQPSQIAHRDGEGWFMLWNDSGLQGCPMRIVRARSYVETHSQVDSELAAREYLPPEQRRGLRGEKP